MTLDLLHPLLLLHPNTSKLWDFAYSVKKKRKKKRNNRSLLLFSLVLEDLKKDSLQAVMATLLLSTKADTENTTTSGKKRKVEPPAGSSSYFLLRLNDIAWIERVKLINLVLQETSFKHSAGQWISQVELEALPTAALDSFQGNRGLDWLINEFCQN